MLLSDHGMMAAAVVSGPTMPTYVSVTATSSGSSATSPRNISLPSVAAGDLLVMAANTGFARPQTTPSGWTRQSTEQTYNNGGSTEGRFDIYYRICNGSEGATVSLAWTGGTSPFEAHVVKITGSAQSSPIDAIAWAASSAGSNATANVSSITTATAETLGLLFVATRPNSSLGSLVNQPSGWTERSDTTAAATTIALSTATQSYSGAAGSKTSGTASFDNAAVAYCTAHLAVKGV